MKIKRGHWLLFVLLGVVAWLIACAPSAPAAADEMRFEVTVSEVDDAVAEEAKTAPTATPPPPDQHWLLAVGETASLLCGEIPKAEGIPAGQLDIDLNGVDSVRFDCAPWEGGPSAAAAPGETDQHWLLRHNQKGYALCGGTSLDGIPAGQWAFKVNGVDVVEATCMAWEGGK